MHPARFLPGAGVPVQNFWLEARRLWGQEGVDGIQNYDLEALGCSGCVSARGWELLHKPGSPEMSLKMFTITNIGNMASSSTTILLVGEDGITIQENLREFSDLQEFKQAMYNLRTAAQLATPWNLSYAVIDGFLRSNNYMDSQLEGVKKAVVLTGWGGQNQGSWGGQNRSGGGGQNLPFTGPPEEKTICKKFNKKRCRYQWFNFSIPTGNGPIRLYHLCNKYVKKDGGKSELCLGKHLRVDHKDEKLGISEEQG